MKFLFIGDIVGNIGCEFLKKNLKKIKEEYKIDIIIANGENSDSENGITPIRAEYIYNSGVDIITTGNHIFKKKNSIWEYLKKSKKLLRPANFPNKTTPGSGFLKFEFKNIKFCVINLLGVISLEPLKSPFDEIDIILEKCNDCLIKIVDLHAEVTSEKRSFGFYVDGKVSAVIGTHTHVQTSDAQILPNNTAYITDVGMVGSHYSVLGIKKENVIKKMREKIYVKFEQENVGKCEMGCVIIEIDEFSGEALSIKSYLFIQ